MIRERVITLISEEKLTTKRLEELTAIDRYTWGNLKNRKQKINEEHLEAIVKVFPEYAYWLVMGMEQPEVGNISPTTKRMQRELNQQGKAG